MRRKRKKVTGASLSGERTEFNHDYDFYWLSEEGLMAARSNGGIVNLSKQVK